MNQMLMAHFEVVKNDNKYTLTLPANSPLGEVYDALHNMLMHVVDMSKKAAEATKAPEAEPAVEAEVVS